MAVEIRRSLRLGQKTTHKTGALCSARDRRDLRVVLSKMRTALSVEGEGEEGVGGAKVTVELVRKKDFTNIPEAACFLDDSTTLVVAVRKKINPRKNRIKKNKP